MLEGWIWKMAAALKSQHKQINVIIADWLTFAHQHYPIAVQNTRYIGQEIADFLEWLEVRAPKSTRFTGKGLFTCSYACTTFLKYYSG